MATKSILVGSYPTTNSRGFTWKIITLVILLGLFVLLLSGAKKNNCLRLLEAVAKAPANSVDETLGSLSVGEVGGRVAQCIFNAPEFAPLDVVAAITTASTGNLPCKYCDSSKLETLSPWDPKYREVRLVDPSGEVVAEGIWAQYTLKDVQVAQILKAGGPEELKTAEIWWSFSEVKPAFGGNGVGGWFITETERAWREKGMIRAIMDRSKTRSGQIGWTTRFFNSTLRQEILNWGGDILFEGELVDEKGPYNIWIYRYR